MRRVLVAVLFCAIVSSAGCSWYDVWFSALGQYYTGGGTTYYEQGQDYDARVESYRTGSRFDSEF
jgi:hypothetical protein